jgi:hypothetical protein
MGLRNKNRISILHFKLLKMDECTFQIAISSKTLGSKNKQK